MMSVESTFRPDHSLLLFDVVDSQRFVGEAKGHARTVLPVCRRAVALVRNPCLIRFVYYQALR